MATKKFKEEKRLLQQYYKQLKAGFIEWEEIPLRYRRLLEKYYSF